MIINFTMTSQQSENKIRKVEPSDDEQPSTSKPMFLFGPQALNFLVQHNPVTILDPIDINSADDVRQAVKAINAVETQQLQEGIPPPKPEANNQTPAQQESDLAQSREPAPEDRKEEDHPATNSHAQEKTSDSQRESNYASGDKPKQKGGRNSAEIVIRERSNETDPRTSDVAGPSRKRRRGRPAKAGPSKKHRQTTSTAEFYRGKLTNYVSFTRHSDSDSDLESCIYYR